jgi:hypothetical protein
MKNPTRIERISAEILAPIVGKALGAPDLSITSWDARLVKGGWEFPRRTIARLSGEARIPGQDDRRSWSLYFKVARKVGRGVTSNIADPYQREALFYKSGYFDDLPGAASAPQCLDVLEPEGDVPWVFLEEVEGSTHEKWPISRYGIAARHLGHLHGGFLTDRPLPKETWANRSEWLVWQREEAPARCTEALDRACTHALSSRFYENTLGMRAWDFLNKNKAFSDALCSLPVTLIHGDMHRNNLIARDDGENEETIFIDWDASGIAQMGIDTGTLIGTSAIFNPPLVASLLDFVELVFESYLAGLRDAGWKGPKAVVRFAIVGYIACIFGMGAPPTLDRVLNEESRSGMEQWWNRPAEEIVEGLARSHEQLLDFGEEATRLLPDVQAYLAD